MATVPTKRTKHTGKSKAMPTRKKSTPPASTKSVPTPPNTIALQRTLVTTRWAPGTTWDPSNSEGFTQGTDKGYDAVAAGVSTERKSVALGRASGFLLDGPASTGFSLPLFITSTNIDTSLAGSTGQSQLVQDFYPKNFVQPVVTVSGMSLDQADYGALCEFVRHCQLKALTTPDSWSESMAQLVVLGRTGIGSKTARNVPVGGRNNGRKVENTFTTNSAKDISHFNQIIKGSHDNIIAKGYIESMPRIHQQFEYAVAWQFDFVVAQMIEGPFRDSAANATNVAMNGAGMWQGLLADAKANGLSTVSKAQNSASLAYAVQNAATLVGETPTGAPTGSSSGGSGTSGATGPAGSASDTHSTQWAKDFLTTLGAPTSQANINSIMAWISKEGNLPTVDQFNPLDTTEAGYGGMSTNSDGVRTYPTWQAGINATVTTLQNGYYPNILQSLMSGNGIPKNDATISGEFLKWSGTGYSGI
jgi:hypothetical protein